MNKHFQTLISSALTVVTLGLTAPNAFSQNTGIIPTPQRVEWQEGKCVLPSASDKKPLIQTQLIANFPVDTNADQGYILDVQKDRILIQATTETGLFYGRQSANQLLDYYTRHGESAIPCMHVVDYPKLKYRGWMDDISRGPIPNMAFLKSVIETMASYKMNCFNLYTEHVFKLDRYPDIAPTDGLTAEEIKELEDFAAQYHIEFFGNQQCLAHAEKTLRIPFYQDMADTKANFNPGTEKTYDFLKYQLEAVAKAYQSPFFNIDCDETEALGNGKAKSYVHKNGSASQVYAQHIQRVYDILKPLGKRVMMWGDIAAKDPVITAQLPKDMLMIVWSYAPSDSYADMIKPFVDQGLEFMVAPGMSMWSTVYPSYETYTKNIANLVRDGYHNGTLGMLNTAWDDSGESLFNSAWHGMAWSAEMSWNPIESVEPAAADAERNARLAEFDRNFENSFLGYPVSDLFNIKQYEHTNIPEFFNTAALYNHILDFYPTKTSEEFYNTNLELCKALEQSKHEYRKNMEAFNDKPLKNTALTRIAYYVCDRQQVVTEMNMLRYKIYRRLQGDAISKESIMNDVDKLLKHLHQVKNEYMDIWDEESRAYSRDIVEHRFDDMAQELLNIPNHVFIHSELNDRGEAVVTLNTLFNDADIYYTTDGRKPSVGENPYNKPIVLSQSATVRALTTNAMGESVISERYVLTHKALGKISKLNSEYATYRQQYAAAGKIALADGLIGGSETYADGNWQGYWGQDIDVDFDFGKTTVINNFKTRFFQNIYDWIMSPNTVEIYTSKNGQDYSLFKTLKIDVDYHSSSAGIYTVQSEDLNLKSRYVKVVIRNGGVLPEWHQAKGQPSYIFCDEIIMQ